MIKPWVAAGLIGLVCGVLRADVVEWSDTFTIPAGPVEYVGDGSAGWTTNLNQWSISYDRQNAAFPYGDDGPWEIADGTLSHSFIACGNPFSGAYRTVSTNFVAFEYDMKMDEMTDGGSLSYIETTFNRGGLTPHSLSFFIYFSEGLGGNFDFVARGTSSSNPDFTITTNAAVAFTTNWVSYAFEFNAAGNEMLIKADGTTVITVAGASDIASGDYAGVGFVTKSGSWINAGKTIAWDNATATVSGFEERIDFTEIGISSVVGLRFQSNAGELYRLQYSTTLQPDSWISTDIILLGSGGTMTAFDPTGYSDQKHYRIIRE